MAPKPASLADIEAAGILYAGLTAWAGLFVTGGLGGISGALTSLGGGIGKRICILGASGGVGSIAVQIAKSENVEVIATCSTDALPIVECLGADHVIDYTSPDSNEKLLSLGPYDIIFDCAGKGSDYATQLPWKFGQYITLSSPLLKNFDEHGIGLGLFKNILNLVESNIKTLSSNRALVKWAYFVPAPQGIEYLKNLVDSKKVRTQLYIFFY